MAYEQLPEPGTYYIKSVAAPQNVIEVPSYNDERAVCSPQATKPTPNQQIKWYIQRSGRGYKIKNVQYGVYLSPHSIQPKYGTVIGTSPSHGPVDWSLMRTHDGFVIQYGEEDKSIDLHYGRTDAGNPMHLWSLSPQDDQKRWKFERISEDVGGEVAETVEDRIAVLSEQLQKKDEEIAEKDRLLAQKERELQDALQSYCKIPAKVIQAQVAELRQKIEGLECLIK
ncbi:hypothetical protein FRC11_011185, partial [Ceratobasidium sp. 423]